MDEGLGDEVALMDMAEEAHLQGKESEYSVKPPESSNLLESRETVIASAGDYPESSFHVLADKLEGKNGNRSASPPMDASKQPCSSPRSMDDAGNMVEELMVRNYDGSNSAVVGTSNNRQRMQARQSQWPHLYQIGGGSVTGISCSNTLYRDSGQALLDVQHPSSSDILVQKTLSNERNEVSEQLVHTDFNGLLGNVSSHGSFRTKILSKSGFSEFFVKNTLKGKGIIYRGPPHDSLKLGPRDQNNERFAGGTLAASDTPLNLSAKTVTMTSSYGITGPSPSGYDHDGVSLRKWLNAGQLKANKVERLQIFRRIVDLVDYSHSQGVALPDLRPSSFKLLQSNQVKYLGSAVPRDMLESSMDQDTPCSDNHAVRRRPLEQGMFSFVTAFAKKQKFSESMNYISSWPQLSTKHSLKLESTSDGGVDTIVSQDSQNEATERNHDTEYGIQAKSSSHELSKTGQRQLTAIVDRLEEKWYTSPEEFNDGICRIASNIYGLGILLFELLGRFDSDRAQAMVMSDLRHRILPPQFLSENPREAGFCLWLLHPEPSSRPSTREILQSELINGLQEVSAEELSSSINQDDAESELLFHFLVSLKEQKQNHASKLVEDIRCLDTDIEEVGRRNCSKKHLLHSCLENDFLNARQPTSEHKEPYRLEAFSQVSPDFKTNDMRLMSNISQLESAYFSMRSEVQLAETDATIRQDNDLLRNHENWYIEQEGEETQNTTDCLGSFFDGLCKYARYSKFEVRGLLRTGDFSNSANVICSLSFDRDADYFAAGGVSKKIKIFDFNSIFNDPVDIHYPVIEMSNESKLSCICWNSYIKNYLASTGYDGVVKLWDVSTGQGVFQYNEHEKRAWSVDFSQVCPTKLASGSDDCSVKLWSINEKNSISTIRNIANVCCVQFSSHSTHLLAFGSADYRTYCYDLRNCRAPWCVLAGHDKAVSYVKFLDSETLVTASTDNSLKIWDLNKTSSSSSSVSACIVTLGGHTNEKNFVGLSVANDYITCGSETNEVFAYHRSLPMPITSHKFGSIDPISGKETDDDNGLFVSSVCWRGKSDMVVAANSSGCLKVLQMV
ncbi:protein SPA1-RELATED 2 isoform X3 [Populus trichocarpa]|uniref:protein SPA1-RELATED 2 isoform X3 n=1 Tax=Populus trichocarpa TaxID=3694 RepID=UPI0022781F40|nr:protein SPA1-RELATED 2 isoform X3 [Populus trichocarpa]